MTASDLLDPIRKFAAKQRLFAPGQTVVVGVSGGPDSTALLHALSRLREDLQISLVVAHLNHGFRGAEADEEAEYVATLCARLNIPCHLERIDVPALRRAARLSAQEAAREARHDFLRRVAAEVGAERIALGHTRDDRIETVLLNLLRGTGSEGLSGMPSMRLPIVRPLYEIRRTETEAYCAAHDLRPRLDSSNLKTDYTRNRLRAELLPHLAAYYNAGIGDAILRMSELVSADNLYLETQAAEALLQVIQTHSPERIVLNPEALRALPSALRRRVLRQAIAAVRGNLHGVGFEILESVLQALENGSTKEVTLPSRSEPRVHLRAGKNEVAVFWKRPPVVAVSWQTPLTIPGRTEMGEAGLYAEATLCANAAELQKYVKLCALMQEGVQGRGATRPLRSLVFRIGEITLPILVRSWLPGDRIRPRNLGGSKKLQDLFTDCKVPANARGRFPVLVDAGGNGRILAVVGLQADETALPLVDEREWERVLQRETVDTETTEVGFLALLFAGREDSPGN